jgi:hypothetical protein
MRLICRHCRRWKAIRPRGLCTRCYETNGVRELYPVSQSNGAVRSGVPAVSRGDLPPERTATVPGTEARIRVLEERAAMGWALFRSDDGPDLS